MKTDGNAIRERLYRAQRGVHNSMEWGSFGPNGEGVPPSYDEWIEEAITALEAENAAMREALVAIRSDAHERGRTDIYGDFIMGIIGLCEAALSPPTDTLVIECRGHGVSLAEPNPTAKLDLSPPTGKVLVERELAQRIHTWLSEWNGNVKEKFGIDRELEGAIDFLAALLDSQGG